MNIYYVAAIWLGMALLTSVISIRVAVPAALMEIVIGALAGNIPGIPNIPGIREHVTQTVVVAGVFLHDRVLIDRLRSIAFALLTPFFFLRAGTLISASALVAGAGVIGALLLVKLAAKAIGVWPVATAFKLPRRERTYATSLMATGLTFGSISALFGLTHHLINQAQYTELLTTVIGPAVTARWNGLPGLVQPGGISYQPAATSQWNVPSAPVVSGLTEGSMPGPAGSTAPNGPAEVAAPRMVAVAPSTGLPLVSRTVPEWVDKLIGVRVVLLSRAKLIDHVVDQRVKVGAYHLRQIGAYEKLRRIVAVSAGSIARARAGRAGRPGHRVSGGSLGGAAARGARGPSDLSDRNMM